MMRNLNVIDALLQKRNWINYSPGTPFNLYSHTQVSKDQLYRELSILYELGFRGISTFGFYNGLEQIPKIAKEIGFDKVVSLLWWPNSELFTLEKTNLKKEITHIDSILLGNELIHKKTTNVTELVKEITELQKSYQIPVTTGLHRLDYISHPELATDIGDYIMYNLHPWWVNIRNNPYDGAGWVKAMYDELKLNPNLPQNKTIIIHEAAWPCGNITGHRVACDDSFNHQEIFYKQLLEYKLPFIWSFSSDQEFAQIKSPPGGFGGLFKADYTPKPVIDLIKNLYQQT